MYEKVKQFKNKNKLNEQAMQADKQLDEINGKNSIGIY